ncbi:MAG: hypothetical protein H7A53_04890 [Akkermansiaceae bacterium]|nr:hypothetical protein [Akkermansiaceae bacterium]MCP5550211.1 hypothetical protein [Akkermansiaceae bacterium]
MTADSSSAARLTALFSAGLAAVLGVAAFLFRDGDVFLVTGFFALAIVALPVALRKDYPLFSPWSFVVLCVTIGLTLRGVYAGFGIPDAETLDDLYRLGRDGAYFVRPAILLLDGLGLMTAGFLFRLPAKPFAFLRVGGEDLRAGAAPVGFVLLAVTLGAAFLYIQRTGGWESAFVSAKRTPIPDLDLSDGAYASHGALRWLGSLGIYGHLVLVATLPAADRGRGLRIALATALLIAACVVPFYASLRSEVALNLCLSAAVLSLVQPRFSPPRLAGLGVVALLAIQLMTLLRSERDDAGALSRLRFGRQAIDSLVLNRNQIELAKTAHIFHAIPDDLDFARGRTIAVWALAPIPRSLWPEKPVVQAGPEIGSSLYGQRVAGVPPGFVAEMYWNFGVAGVAIGCLAFGMLLRYLDDTFRPRGPESPGGVVLFVAGPMLFGFRVLGNSLGHGLFQLAANLAMAATVLWLTARLGRWRRVTRMF